MRYLGPLFELGVTTGLTDGQLLERFTTGPRADAEIAFSSLLERHGPMVLRVCRGILKDEHSAMDAFQATFLVLIRTGRRLWVRESLGPWLHRVACHAAGRLKRDAARRRTLELNAAQRQSAQAQIAGTGRDDLVEIIHTEIDRLPEHYRVAIVNCDLEGRTCEEAARVMRCPVGTVASRLARARGLLRTRLVRHGFGPAAALGAAFPSDAATLTMPSALAETTIKLAVSPAANRTAIGASSVAAVSLAEDISRSLLMSKVRTLATVFMASGCAALLAAAALRAFDQPATPSDKVQNKEIAPAAALPKRGNNIVSFDLGEASKDSLVSIFANMRPLLHDDNGVRFQSRVAVLKSQGIVVLWSVDSKTPLAPVLRHDDPIREFEFLTQANLLITTSESSVKVWNALTGELRKELKGEVMRPLLRTPINQCAEPGPDPIRFATIDAPNRTVTTWDAATLTQVASFRPEGSAKLVGAGVAKDGKTLATIGEDRTVTLWVVGDTRPLATFHAPSSLVNRCFVDDQHWWPHQPTVQLDERFWEIVAPLLPASVAKHSQTMKPQVPLPASNEISPSLRQGT
jgi:RNA polymerase sigma factor (sigma-70 family)